MQINLTLENCNDWEFFCDEEGWSVWVVTEGGGDVALSLTEEQVYKHGIFRSK